MLKITRNPEFTHRVVVSVPVDGGHADQPFKARFRVVPQSDLTEIAWDLAEIGRRVLVGWEDIVDDNDGPIPFSDALRDQLLALPYFAIAVARAYSEAVQGAKRGN